MERQRITRSQQNPANGWATSNRQTWDKRVEMDYDNKSVTRVSKADLERCRHRHAVEDHLAARLAHDEDYFEEVEL